MANNRMYGISIRDSKLTAPGDFEVDMALGWLERNAIRPDRDSWFRKGGRIEEDFKIEYSTFGNYDTAARRARVEDVRYIADVYAMAAKLGVSVRVRLPERERGDDAVMVVNLRYPVGCGVVEHALDASVSMREVDRLGGLSALARTMREGSDRLYKSAQSTQSVILCSRPCTEQATCAFCDRPMPERRRTCAYVANGEPWRMSVSDELTDNAVSQLCDETRRWMALDCACEELSKLSRSVGRGEYLDQAVCVAYHERDMLGSLCKELKKHAPRLRLAVDAANAAKRGEPVDQSFDVV